MPDPSIATRYAEALFEASKAEQAVRRTQEQLDAVDQMLHAHPELAQLLCNPGISVDDKIGTLDRLLKGAWSPTLQAFIRMVLALGRAEFLRDVAEAFQAAADADEGRLRAVVRSARPLPDAVLSRLRARLEHSERKQIELTSEVDPALLGGLQIRLGFRLIDGSVRRQLDDLKEQLMTVRVH